MFCFGTDTDDDSTPLNVVDLTPAGRTINSLSHSLQTTTTVGHDHRSFVAALQDWIALQARPGYVTLIDIS